MCLGALLNSSVFLPPWLKYPERECEICLFLCWIIDGQKKVKKKLYEIYREVDFLCK